MSIARWAPASTHTASFCRRFEESPAARLIETPAIPIGPLLDDARVKIKKGEGYCYVDVRIPAITLMEEYYQRPIRSICISTWRTN